MARIKKQNILITGAVGFVGRALVRSLLAKGNNLFLVSKDRGFKCPGAKFFYGDLNDKKFCRRIIRNIDVVYYLAGYKRNIAFHCAEPFDFFAGNLQPLLAFLAAAKKSKIKKIIYLSSTIVDYFNAEKGVIDGYAWGKFANELALKSFAAQTKMAVTIIRSAAIYGPGDNFSPQTANFIPAMIGRVKKAGNDLLVWGNGLRQMQFIFIDDLVANLVAAANSNKNFFIVGNPQVVSVDQVVKKIIKLLAKRLIIKHDRSKPDKPSQLVTFSNLIKPKIKIDQGLAKTVNYYQKIHD